MVSKATITLVLLSKLCHRSLGAPAGDKNLGVESLGSASSLTKGSQQSISLFGSSSERPQTSTTQVYGFETLLLSPLYEPSPTTTTPSDRGTRPPPSFSSSQSHTLTPSITSSAAPYAKTVTVTEEVSTTITVSADPVTVTEILFPPPPISTSLSLSPSRTSTAGLGPAKSIWLAPTNLSDLSAFHVSKFTGGQGNLEFVNRVPAEAKRQDGVFSSDGRNDNNPPSITLLQFLFPAGSIDPGKKPQGGAEFYASPIDIISARNVTLQYSVFFPLGFDFVLGGKMPGLYGGHTGCSGGDPAVDCFSTRLMWRERGAGELYLYASKKHQSDKLCRAEGSVCDDMYGVSIGRGFFFWKEGDWTTVKQTVFLNTPGKQDGVFTLDVDGKRVISRNDLLYRDDLGKGNGKGKAVKHKTTTKHTKTKPAMRTTPVETTTTSSSDDGDLLGLGPLLSSLLGGLRREVGPAQRSDDGHVKSPITTTIAADAMDAFSSTSPPYPELVLRTPLPMRTQIPEPSSQDLLSGMDFEIASAVGTEVTFVGIFFSTFFGGHDDKYATPRDQHVWFKDFGLAYNS